MIGFMFGTACLFGLVYVLGRHRMRGFAHAGCGGWEGQERHGRWRGSRGFSPLGFLFQRLGTSHEQEQVIDRAVDDFTGRLRQSRDELKRSRADLADALRADYFDPEKLGDAFARQDSELAELRKTLVASLSRVHEALDERQRAELAELIAQGRLGRTTGWPYRARGL